MYDKPEDPESITCDTSLPTFDFELLQQGNPESIAALRKACHEIGFFYLINTPIGKDQWRQIFADAASFFALPEDRKNTINMGQVSNFRGYTGIGEEVTLNKPDNKEVLDLASVPWGDFSAAKTEPFHRFLGENQWPDSSWLPGFRERVEHYMDSMSVVGLEVMRALALALGLPRLFFDPYFTDPYYMMRMIHYPMQHEGEKKQTGVGSHTDFGCLTILGQDAVGGLEVQNASGRWISAPPVTEGYVVNLGDMLEVWTGGYFVATPHRVTNPSHSCSRYSVPFFFEPNLDAKIEVLPDFCQDSSGYQGIQSPCIYGNHLFDAFCRSYPHLADGVL